MTGWKTSVTDLKWGRGHLANWASVEERHGLHSNWCGDNCLPVNACAVRSLPHTTHKVSSRGMEAVHMGEKTSVCLKIARDNGVVELWRGILWKSDTKAKNHPGKTDTVHSQYIDYLRYYMATHTDKVKN